MSVADKIDGNSSRIYGTIPVLTKECPWTRSGHLKLAHRLTFNCFGVCFNLFANQAELMRDASAYLPLECEPCSSSSATRRYSLVRRTDSQETSYQLYRNERRLFAGGDRRDLLERFGSTISLDVAEASPLRTFVHAGIVAWGKAAVLIPGRRSPAIVLATLKQVVSDALVVRGIRGEASQVVEWITANFGSPKTLLLNK